MIGVQLDVEGVTASFDPADGGWRIMLDESEFQLREWTWGERHRLISASTQRGRLDRSAFLDGLVALLVTPAPPHELTALFACCALKLMGVPEGAQPVPLAEAERWLAERFGWRPGDLDGERSGDIDRLLSQLAVEGQSVIPHRAPGPGWKTIRFDDSGSVP